VRFSCDECGRSYVASDDVAGRAFRMRCKECGSEIVVRPPGASDGPFAVAAHAPVTRPAAPRDGAKRPAFDPFEGDELALGDVTVMQESLEILDRTPPARPLPRPSTRTAPPTPPATPVTPAGGAPAASPPERPRPRTRPGRMLPAEDEAMLGPPGAEDRRTVPRWVVILALGALAAGGALALLR
jgi:hypothetical protein